MNKSSPHPQDTEELTMPQSAREWAELIADQFEIVHPASVDAIEEGVARGRSESEATLVDGRLRGELKMAMLAFKRIAQERGTPNSMREIAKARAHYISELLGCRKHGVDFISPGVCPFCAEESAKLSQGSVDDPS